MKLSVRRPTSEEIASFLEEQRKSELSYENPGISREDAPRGFRAEHHRAELGRGEEAYGRAIRAIYDWKMYETPWTSLWPERVPVTKDATVVIAAHHGGAWSLNACRVVYKIDERQPIRRCGFALGTLPGHAMRGEERFVVEWNPEDDVVSFDVYSVARTAHPLARAAFPYTGSVRRRFVQDAEAAMRGAVAGD